MGGGGAFRMSPWRRCYSPSPSLARRRAMEVPRRQSSSVSSPIWEWLRNRLRLFFRFLGLRHLRLHDDPAHAKAFRIDDFDRQIAEGGAIAGGHFAADARSDVAANRFLCRLADIDFQPVRKILDQIIAAHAISAASQRLDFRTFAVELILNLPEQLLGDVLQRDDPGGPAVLVEDDGHMRLVLDEL